MTTLTTLRAGDLHVVQAGAGPDVLLIAGLGDPAEAWQAQLEGLADRFRVTAFDNRGAGRSPLPEGELTVAGWADDAAAVLDAAGIEAAHVAGFSGGSIIAQELALRHPERVRSLVLVSTWARIEPYFRAMADSWRWIAERAPSERAFLEAFYVWIYTARAHADGTVAQIIDEALAFEHPASTEAIQRSLDALMAHETAGRLPAVDVPALVLAGGHDISCPPRLGREVAQLIPGARFEVWPQEAHQPFQERPEAFNARVAAFWGELDAR